MVPAAFDEGALVVVVLPEKLNVGLAVCEVLAIDAAAGNIGAKDFGCCCDDVAREGALKIPPLLIAAADELAVVLAALAKGLEVALVDTDDGAVVD